MDIYAQIAQRIIKQQETIIGPVAVEQAKQVTGLSLDWTRQEVAIVSNGRRVVDELVEKYKELFGQISVQVCKDAVATLIGELKQEELPETLK